MKVQVRQLRSQGRNMNRDEQSVMPPHQGILQVAEARDIELGRPVTRARLVDETTGTETDVLPVLIDAKLLWVEGGKFRLTGFERIGKSAYLQTWAVELA